MPPSWSCRGRCAARRSETSPPAAWTIWTRTACARSSACLMRSCRPEAPDRASNHFPKLEVYMDATSEVTDCRTVGLPGSGNTFLTSSKFRHFVSSELRKFGSLVIWYLGTLIFWMYRSPAVRYSLFAKYANGGFYMSSEVTDSGRYRLKFLSWMLIPCRLLIDSEVPDFRASVRRSSRSLASKSVISELPDFRK